MQKQKLELGTPTGLLVRRSVRPGQAARAVRAVARRSCTPPTPRSPRATTPIAPRRARSSGRRRCRICSSSWRRRCRASWRGCSASRTSGTSCSERTVRTSCTSSASRTSSSSGARSSASPTSARGRAATRCSRGSACLGELADDERKVAAGHRQPARQGGGAEEGAGRQPGARRAQERSRRARAMGGGRKGELGKKWLSYKFAHAMPDALQPGAAQAPVAGDAGDDRRPRRAPPRARRLPAHRSAHEFRRRCSTRSTTACTATIATRTPAPRGCVTARPARSSRTRSASTLNGCPLDEKISEMHLTKRRGDSIGALALVCIDNPMCPGTGHRICNDCMKACVYQKQEPVNIPQIETGVLTDVLGAAVGLRDLRAADALESAQRAPAVRAALSRQGRARRRAGAGRLHAGAPPAQRGVRRRRHRRAQARAAAAVGDRRLAERHAARSGAQLPLRRARRSHPRRLRRRLRVRHHRALGQELPRRCSTRRCRGATSSAPTAACASAARVTLDDAWELGFAHVAIAAGAGKPTIIELKNNLIRGVRKASRLPDGAAAHRRVQALVAGEPAGAPAGHRHRRRPDRHRHRDRAAGLLRRAGREDRSSASRRWCKTVRRGARARGVRRRGARDPRRVLRTRPRHARRARAPRARQNREPRFQRAARFVGRRVARLSQEDHRFAGLSPQPRGSREVPRGGRALRRGHDAGGGDARRARRGQGDDVQEPGGQSRRAGRRARCASPRARRRTPSTKESTRARSSSNKRGFFAPHKATRVERRHA